MQAPGELFDLTGKVAVVTLTIEPPSPSAMRDPKSTPRRNGPRAFTACTLS